MSRFLWFTVYTNEREREVIYAYRGVVYIGIYASEQLV